MTAGNSLSENEWVSRRKWTSTTLSSAAAKATAMTGQGTTSVRRRRRPAVELHEVDQARDDREGAS